MIIIDIEYHFAPENVPVLCINAPTGIFYTAQCGGLGCYHPEIEGFCIALPQADFSSIDTCNHSGGCYEINEDNPRSIELANLVDRQLKLSNCNVRYGFSLSFDFGRMELFMEAWIPVTISGGQYDGMTGFLFTNNNCD